MSDKRRPPSLHRGPAPAREPIPDPDIVTFTFTMTNREIVTTTATRDSIDAMSEEISGAIALSKTVTLHDPSGARIIVNTAHVVLVNVR